MKSLLFWVKTGENLGHYRLFLHNYFPWVWFLLTFSSFPHLKGLCSVRLVDKLFRFIPLKWLSFWVSCGSLSSGFRVPVVVDDPLAELDPLLHLELGHIVGLSAELGVLPLQPVHLHWVLVAPVSPDLHQWNLGVHLRPWPSSWGPPSPCWSWSSCWSRSCCCSRTWGRSWGRTWCWGRSWCCSRTWGRSWGRSKSCCCWGRSWGRSRSCCCWGRRWYWSRSWNWYLDRSWNGRWLDTLLCSSLSHFLPLQACCSLWLDSRC